MTRKLLIVGIALIGMTLALGSNAWAGPDRRGRDHKKDQTYHRQDKTPAGHHYGWAKGKGNRHRPACRQPDRRPHRPVYRPHDPHHGRDRKVVEKHVYHHYRTEERHDDHIRIAVSVVDQFLGVAVAFSGTR
jgi:hypothetical protein